MKAFCVALTRRALLLLAPGFGFAGLPGSSVAQNPETQPGLVVTFTPLDAGKGGTDLAVLPNVQLYVPSGQPVSPFLPAGRFSAVWEGLVSVDLRGDYVFSAELNGDLKLEINGAVALEAGSESSGPGKSVRLSKGTNAFKAAFTAPPKGDAFVRLHWTPRRGAAQPIPIGALSHLQTPPALKTARQLRLGRELFVEHRCARCHTGPTATAGIPELQMDAPAFNGIGSRRNFEWMARWIADPRALRPTATMPATLRGPKAKEEAEAIAAYLASLKSAEATDGKPPAAEQAGAGEALFTALHCVACHNTPGTAEQDPAKIPLTQVAAKFAVDSLTAFLLKPEEHYVWIRMPRFKLDGDQAARLAAYLLSKSDPAKATAAPADAAMIERGRKLVQATGCLNCHSADVQNEFSTKSLSALPGTWAGGCLAESPPAGAKAPFFGFTAVERDALRAFGATDRASLSRHVPAEYAERQIARLNCTDCHGNFDGFPTFAHLNGKLKPEWVARFLAGQVDYKPRPWIESQMPAFASRAELLAEGLALHHGHPPRTPPEPPIDPAQAKLGRQLVSSDGGFSCIACHAVGQFGATQVFESAGPNLAHAAERLLKPYYLRWLLSPLSIDPQTKMPVYFDEGRSPLTEVLDGDALKQIDALWQYLRLGDKIPPPAEPGQ